jgi:hypothetical protein
MAKGTTNEELLIAAGYVFDRVYCRWEDPTSGRQIHGEVATMLTVEQMEAWIADGRGRGRTF